MKYFFILGNNPELSLAEIYSVFARSFEYDLISPSVLIVETEKEINAKELIARLGGTIKIGKILHETSSRDRNYLLKLITQIKSPKAEGKFKFGFSYYGKKNIKQKALAMEYKKYLKEKSVSSRWVNSKDSALSSVVVEQNKLTENGLEIVFIEAGNKLLLGKTLAVQPFKDLSFRDYGRPARDDRSGMLPPKLAQIMINLSGIKPDKDIRLLDPFCGSGTILMEATVMGYPYLIGSDISQKAVEDTRKNLNWIERRFKILNPPAIRASLKFEIFNSDAKLLASNISQNSVDLLVTEPYLGPQRGKLDLNKIIPELEKLYTSSLQEFYKILKPKGRIVIIFPLIHAGGTKKQVKPNLNNFKIINPLSNIDLSNLNIKKDENTLLYGRNDQRVWRNIVVLEKKMF